MAAVELDFLPPTDPDIVKLHIYAAADENDIFNIIETVDEVGEYPTYITRYTTTLAPSPDWWFQIEWENSKGALSARSNPIQGGSTTAVNEIVERVLQRDPTLNENVVANVVEANLEGYFKADPYTVDYSTLSYRQREGLTILSLAFSLEVSTAGGETSRYTAGLVSEETKQDSKDMKELIKLANKWLGLPTSRIAQMEEIAIGVGLTKKEKDQSRLLISEFV